MTIGFVYALTNAAMPGIVKIGCTERSPHERAEELSKPTSVPLSFGVLCYIEVRDFQRVERDFHTMLNEARISQSREFFRISDLNRLLGLFFFHDDALAFCGVDLSRFDEFRRLGSINPYLPIPESIGSGLEARVDQREWSRGTH